MATRRKTPIKAPRTEAAFAVVLEDLSSKFDVFGEALQGVRDELHGFRGEVDRRFGQVELAILEHSREIRQLRGGLEDVRGELGTLREEMRGEFGNVREEMRGEFGNVREEMRGEFGNVRDELRGELEDVRGELREVRTTVTRIETALATKVDREEVASIAERALARR